MRSMHGIYRIGAGLTVLLAGVLPQTGCGPSNPDTVPVHGRVTWQGEPIGQGTVAFMPAEGQDDRARRVASGRIESDGSYRLSTFGQFDGAMPGSYQVAISDTGEFPFEVLEMQEPQTTASVLPARYAIAHTSGLTAEVPEDAGSVEVDFALP